MICARGGGGGGGGSEYVACQLAKGTQPSRQGYLAGNTFHSSMSMVCMDLMGPLMSVNKGRRSAQQPVHIFVIVDPFSHRVWLDTIPDKRAETVYLCFRLFVFGVSLVLIFRPSNFPFADSSFEFSVCWGIRPSNFPFEMDGHMVAHS